MNVDFRGLMKLIKLKNIIMNQTENLVPSGNIPYALMLDLHDIYLQGKHKLLSNDLQQKEDTKTIWFELNDEMREFLTATLNDHIVTGIRIYFMAYPNSQAQMHGMRIPSDPNDVSQLTIGLVTTSTDSEGKHPDYPETTSKIKMVIAPPINHGELCPNRCD